MRQAHITVLPFYLRKAKQLLEMSEISAPQAIALWLETARAFRQVGNLDGADLALANALSRLPCPGDFYAAIKREQVKLCLDREFYQEARLLALEIDCDEVDRGKDAAPVFFRDESKFTLETWLLLAEIALVFAAPDEAKNHLERAARLHAAAEEERLARISQQGYAARTLRTLTSRREAEQASDTRERIRFLEAVRLCAAGEVAGWEILSQMAYKLRQPGSSRQLLTAALAVLEPEEGRKIPGLNAYEAQRWHLIALQRPLVNPAVFNETLLAPTPISELIPAPPPMAASESAIIQALENTTSAQVAALETMTHLVLAQMDKLAAQNQTFDRATCAGSFAHLDLGTMLQHLLEVRLTGFVHLQWTPAAGVESAVSNNLLHPLARSGEGWVFLVGGKGVIDATLANFDPCPHSLDDTMEATKMLEGILQLALNIGLGGLPEGYARFYPAPSVQARRQRLNLPDGPAIFSLVTEREKALGLITDFEDEIGEWG
jgi:hypothetical protein